LTATVSVRVAVTVAVAARPAVEAFAKTTKAKRTVQSPQYARAESASARDVVPFKCVCVRVCV